MKFAVMNMLDCTRNYYNKIIRGEELILAKYYERSFNVGTALCIVIRNFDML